MSHGPLKADACACRASCHVCSAFCRDVEAQECLALGRPLLIENIEEELDPVLDPVLDRRVLRKGRGLTMQLADKEARENFLRESYHCPVRHGHLVFPCALLSAPWTEGFASHLPRTCKSHLS